MTDLITEFDTVKFVGIRMNKILKALKCNMTEVEKLFIIVMLKDIADYLDIDYILP